MTIPDTLAKCLAEPRYAVFVDYLTGVVRSGSFSGPELVAAAALAAAIAEASASEAAARDSEFVRRFDAAAPPRSPDGV